MTTADTPTLYCVQFTAKTQYQCFVTAEEIGVEDTADAVWDYIEKNPYSLKTNDRIDTDLGSAEVDDVEETN